MRGIINIRFTSRVMVIHGNKPSWLLAFAPPRSNMMYPFQPIIVSAMRAKPELRKRQDRPFPEVWEARLLRNVTGFAIVFTKLCINHLHFRPGERVCPFESVFLSYFNIGTNLAKHKCCDCVMGIEWSSLSW